jgi:hypothetical protein
MHYFTPRRAGHFLLAAFSGMIVFHLLVIRGTIPVSLIWGGGATPDNAVGLELIAIGVIALFIFVIANNLGYIKPLFPRLMRWSMWLICGYLCLNTLSNAVSLAPFAQFFFAPLTLVMAICAGRVAYGQRTSRRS